MFPRAVAIGCYSHLTETRSLRIFQRLGTSKLSLRRSYKKRRTHNKHMKSCSDNNMYAHHTPRKSPHIRLHAAPNFQGLPVAACCLSSNPKVNLVSQRPLRD
eukprot:9026629-Pyramimonas_sp.AAC.1